MHTTIELAAYCCWYIFLLSYQKKNVCMLKRISLLPKSAWSVFLLRAVQGTH